MLPGIDDDISQPQPRVDLQLQSKIRSQFYNYVRRLPSRESCEILLRIYFSGVNNFNGVLGEPIFWEQYERWNAAFAILLKETPEKLPEDLQFFPAVLFNVLAIALQFLPVSYDTRIENLKFAPVQTFAELSQEYSDCGEALSRLLKSTKRRPTFTGVQASFLRDWWLANNGDLLKSWNHSGQTVK